MNEEQMCGLFDADQREIPLEGVRIDARLAGLATQVTVAQRYRNREAVPVEAVYVFPLEEGAAVCGFEARIGDKVVRGRVEEREKAFEIYDDAMADGHGVFLLDQERPNVFTASVGNLRPGETVEIRITYVTLARREGATMRLMIPTTVSPRYVAPDAPREVGQPDSERVNPERWLAVPYGLQLQVEVDADAPIRGVESPSHPIRTTLRDQSATIELARERAALDRDFVLLVETAAAHEPTVRVAREADGTRVCQVTFHPDLEDRDAAGSEVLFLLDCSGSMIGDSIDQARQALALSIRALEEGDTFNVVRFGIRHESLWRRPRSFDEGTLEAATDYIDRAQADLGGTEIMTPLKWLLELRSERRRQVLLLTDGEVANEHEIVRLAAAHASGARIFTFGIGAGSSEYLVRELARVTGGAAEFIFPGERIEPKVLRMFGRVRSPALDDVELDWGGLDVEQAPARMPPVFAGDSLTVFGRVRSGAGLSPLPPRRAGGGAGLSPLPPRRAGGGAGLSPLPPRRAGGGAIVLRAGGKRWTLDVDLDGAEEGGPIPALWARETVRDLERGVEPRRGSAQRRPEAEEQRRRRLVEVCRRYGLISSAASYVAVEERPEGERVEESAELRRIPIQLTIGWGGIGRLTPGRAAAVAAWAPALAAAAMSTDLYMPASAPVQGLGDRLGAGVQNLASGLGGLLPGLKKPVPSGKQRPLILAPLPPRRAGPAARPAAAPRQRPSDRLYALLMTQKADGSFRLSAVLAQWLGPALGEIERAIAERGEGRVATAVVLALLERDESAREDQWRPAIRKARKWLERHGFAAADDFDAVSLLDEVRVVSA